MPPDPDSQTARMRRDQCRISDREVADRLALIRSTKLARSERGENPIITDEDLDGLLGEGDSRRARCRLEGLPYRHRGPRPRSR